MTRPTDTSSFKSRAFSRRAVLRGTGCAMALPWLESVSAMAQAPTPADHGRLEMMVSAASRQEARHG